MRVLITGASRGIGLEFARQYLADGHQVIACCRDPKVSIGIQRLADKYPAELTIEALDVGQFDHIEQLAVAISGQAIDLLINNAGIYRGQNTSLGNLNYDDWREIFHINTMAPIKMIEMFRPHLQLSNHPVIVTVSSKMGSIEDNTSGGSYLYRTSKTAVNSAMRSISHDLANDGIKVIILHPGWVQTDMGGPNGLISAEDSVKAMRKTIDKVELRQSGQFFNYDGSPIPW